MPIKFRCQYCRQMLGISRTRAGALVDCPRCGRSLRVPQIDGAETQAGTATDPVGMQRGRDVDLIDALQSLAELSQDLFPAAVANAGAANAASDLLSTDVQSESHDSDRLRIVPLTNVRETPVNEPPSIESGQAPESAVPSPTGLRPVASNSEVHTEAGEHLAASEDSVERHRSAGWEEAIDVLGAISPAVGASSSAVDAMGGAGSASSGSRRRSRDLFMLAVGIVLGFGAAWFVLQPRDRDADGRSADSGIQNADVATSDEQGLKQPVDAALPGRRGMVSGEVSFVDAAGAQRPDDGALLILAPVTAVGRLRLDGTSLREPAADLNQTALAAALNHLGVSFIRADQAGHFYLPRLSDQELVLIAVSRHSIRTTDEPIPVDVQNSLSQYFVELHPFIGRLACQVVSVREASGVPAELQVRF